MSDFNNRITQLFKIDYPIIQAGMIWCSGWELAAAVSNAGGLGIIGSGSMYPDILREHIRKCKAATQKTFGVNVPLLYKDIEQHMQIIIEEEVPVVFTSAGNPKTWTGILKKEGVAVVHVCSSAKFAMKSEEAGVEAVVAEGFEAGGHNGREETTTICLIPLVKEKVSVPIIAAGGIASGKSMMACFALGAEGVQIGSRFVASAESSAHENFKQHIISSKEGDTILTLKELVPVRMMKNNFYKLLEDAYAKHADIEELEKILGRARAKKGMFEGDLNEGELEVGQVAASIRSIKPAAEIVHDIWQEFLECQKQISAL